MPRPRSLVAEPLLHLRTPDPNDPNPKDTDRLLAHRGLPRTPMTENNASSEPRDNEPTEPTTPETAAAEAATEAAGEVSAEVTAAEPAQEIPAAGEEASEVAGEPPASGGEGAAEEKSAGEPASEDGEAHAAGRPELTAEGQRWGYVDEEGNVRLHGGEGEPGRVVGKVKGNAEAALGYFALKFQQIELKLAELESEVAAASDRPRFLGRVQRMLSWMPEANALGDIPALVERLRQLEASCGEHLVENLRKKEELCARAEALVESQEWRVAAEAIKGLQAEWKALGPVPREHADAIWARFRGAADRFFGRRQEHYQDLDRERSENLRKKEELCARAEALSGSTDWRKAADELKALQADWKKIGPVPKEQGDAIWARFRGAADVFFERRKQHFDQLDHERAENLKLKEGLCVEVEQLAEASDWGEAAQGIKALQARWKAIGPVPKDQADAIWARFRGACDRFFARRGERAEEPERERLVVSSAPASNASALLGAGVLVRKREQAARLQESIDHDRANIERWQATLTGLRSGGREDEIRASLETKIADVTAKIETKEQRLAELQSLIRQIEGTQA